MSQTTDIILASPDQFDAILADVGNGLDLDVALDAGVTIDDVVAIVSILRSVLDDRKAWWALRREAYARFATHATFEARSLAEVPDALRDEIAVLDGDSVDATAASWLQVDEASPGDLETATRSLNTLVDVCSRGKASASSILLRTNQPPNDFEVAFGKLDDSKARGNFERAFDSWDEAKRHDAHQRYNYYVKEGEADCLKQVLRDLTRPKSIRINLKTDQRTLLKHLKKRVKAYCKTPAPELGEASDPIQLITLTFDVEYEGYVDLNFNTLPNALDELRWEERCEDCLEFPRWHDGLERFSCDEQPLKMTLQDGSKVVVEPDGEEDLYDRYIGDMLRDTMLSARESGEFAKLPLADGCVMWVGGTHTNYAWPDEERLEQDGRVAK